MEKIIVVLLLYIPVLAYDLPKLKRCKLHERIFYWMLMLVSLYLGLEYMFDLHFPTPIQLINLMLAKPGKFIFDLLKEPS